MLDAQAKRRRERVEAGKRRSSLGVDVAVALAARDEAVRRYEVEAGRALAALTGAEGLTVAEACEWAGDVSPAEVKRLVRAAAAAAAAAAAGDDDDGGGVDGSEGAEGGD
ncbi:hypothetical protein IFT73_00840 [Aeromicrobium sp. CFBP 8757]|uniref:hypothetical protein n=1 Tax=Aeromicrobium sp. CFBP 8757 TaxID=2775288 RepID=UPI0017823451|nr:hypothetical protein [Aeromicrobium sp. CFBP 8757]MBD8605384.1 hypothetical protein [Aeromicrobium sp. CFBP 8757]